MCAVSMIMDHYHDKWVPMVPYVPFGPTNPLWPRDMNGNPFPQTYPEPPPITPAEIEEFRKLLDRAREYDKRNNEPDCELDEKKEAVKRIADQLGVKIDFL